MQESNKQQAKAQLQTLIEKFEAQTAYYQTIDYNETQVRRDFIDPFFKILGWDMDNTLRQRETYREVKMEYKFTASGRKKSPDYSFNISGKSRFFVEAKKPFVSIKDQPEPAKQLRDYAWNASLIISVVTDFEEFAIYDCTRKPRKSDRASTKRLKYLHYSQYLQEFDFLWDTFGYESVMNGSIERYGQKNADLKNAEPVDKAFLQSLEDWRTYLATNIIHLNPDLDEYEINFAVQQTIDRIVFLKVCEDRMLEREGNLIAQIKKGTYYQNLYQYFVLADQKYNSGLFDLKKDKVTAGLSIDNKVIKNIIEEVYGENEDGITFNFNIIPIEILGYAYEQFLGKVIYITPAKSVQIEEKPEVRKAGGVYYTPQYIVDYIVEETLGKLIAGKTPEEISAIKVLDPSCGSGSFLIGAYQALLDYHLAYYKENPTFSSPLGRGRANTDVLTPDGKLSTAEKKRILLNNIFGVDIDSQAVEVTKLSLLLKALEGETEASINTSLKIFNERVLPSIDGNIQCGNSLIGTDFYNTGLFLTPKEERKINVFDWKSAFKEVFKQGGFDVVIGNPPYVTIGGKEDTLFLKEEVKHLINKYFNHEYKPNLWAFFYEKGFQMLKNNGMVSFIVPRTFIDNLYYAKLRNFFAKEATILEVLKLDYEVFNQATTGGTCICIFEKDKAINFPENLVRLKIYEQENENLKNAAKIIFTPQSQILIGENKVFNFQEKHINTLFEKIKQQGTMLDNFCSVNNGVNTGNAANVLLSKQQKTTQFLKILEGKDIHRYFIQWNGNWINYDPTLKNKIQLSDLKTKQNKIDFALRSPEIFSNPKIIIRQTGDKIIACIDKDGFITRHSTHCILAKSENINLLYVNALLNSKLMDFYYQNLVNEKGKAFAEVKAIYIKSLPIRLIDFNNPIEKQAHDEIVKFVEMLLELSKRLQKATLPADIRQLEARIQAAEYEINQIVYQLYNLTKEEIKLIYPENE